MLVFNKEYGMELSTVKQVGNNYFTVNEAAQFLGVSAGTLRNWDKAGKLTPKRHPMNGYRMYRHEDLLTVLESNEIDNTLAPLTSSSLETEILHRKQAEDALLKRENELIGSAAEPQDAAARQFRHDGITERGGNSWKEW